MKIGVLGLGSIGTRHANNLRALGHEVISYDPITDTHALRQKIIAAVDAVVIASPTKHHFQDLIDCMAAGKPPFVEKPIVATHDELKNLQFFGPLKSVFVGNNLRFHSCVLKAKEWLPRVGTPLWASFTVAQYTHKSGYLYDGVILNWGSHEIDLALHLLGPAKVAYASARFTGDLLDDIADMILVHGSGCRTAIHMDYVTKDEIRGGWIVGDKGQMGIDLSKRIVQLWNKDFFIGQDSWDENYVDEMKAWIRRMERKMTLGATGEEGLATLEICLEAKRMAMK